MMQSLLKFVHGLDPLVLALAGFGVALIFLVIVTNTVQMRKARQRAEALRVPSEGDILPNGSNVRDAAPARIEPSLHVGEHIDDTDDSRLTSREGRVATDGRVPSPAVTRSSGYASSGVGGGVAPGPSSPQSDALQASAEIVNTSPSPTPLSDSVDIALDNTTAATDGDGSTPVPLSPREPTAPIDGRVHSMVKLRFPTALASEKVKHITDQVAAHYKKSQAWTWSSALGAWSSARPAGGATPAADVIAFSVPLATRSGAVTESYLREWMGAIAQAGVHYGADVVYAPIHEDAKRAVELDQFCGNLDLVAGVSLMRPDRSAIPGTRIRGTLEAEGFRLLPEGYFVLLGEDGAQPTYEVRSIHGQAMNSEALRHEGVHGLSLTLDVMRVANPVQQFDLMRALAKRLSTRLEATVVDDRGHALNDAMFTQIRTELEKRVTAARTAGIEPGSPLARTLFGE